MALPQVPINQLMLPGQAAAPPGSADMTMMYVLHHAFRRDLADFVTAAERIPIDDRAAWQRLHARWATFSELLHDHHTKEDSYLWPLLVGKATAASDLTALATLAEMEAEHGDIDPLLDACTQGFARLATHADGDARSSLVVRLARTRQHLGDHLSHEETDAIAILQRYVPGAEWDALERSKFRGGMTLAQVRTMVPWAYKGLTPRAKAHLDKTAGPPFRIIHRLGRRRFARGETATFGA